MESIRKNYILNACYSILNIALPLVTTPYVSRVLGAEGIGFYSFNYSIASYFALLAMLGINNYGNRTVSIVRDDKEKLAKTISNIYCIQLIISILAMILYSIYVFAISSNPHVSIIMVSVVLAASLNINWIFFGLEKFKLTVIRSSIVKIATVILVFIFVESKSDIYIYVTIMSGSILVSNLTIWPFVKKYTRFIRPTWIEMRKHIKPILILFVPIIAISLYKIMDKIMLGSMTTSFEVGYYESSLKILAVPLSFITALGTVMMPRISSMVNTGKNKESKLYLYQSLIFVIFLSCGMSFGIMGISDIFVPIFYGDGFEKCIQIFYFLMPSCVFLAIASVIRTQFLIPYSKDKVYVISVILGASVNLLLNFLLIPKLQSVGAAIGTLGAEFTVCGYQIIMSRKYLQIKKMIKLLSIFLIISLIMVLAIKLLPINKLTIEVLLIKIGIGGSIYIMFSVYVYNKLIKKDN